MTITEWVEENKGKVFRYLVYRKIFTPYEIDQKFTDESQYEDTGYTVAKVSEVIELPNGDCMLKFDQVCRDYEDDPYESVGYSEYHKLNDIKLLYFDIDNCCDGQMSVYDYTGGEE